MQQGNQYHRFGYQPFNEQTPRPQSYERQSYEQGGTNFDESGQAPGAGFVALVSSPLVMTGALISAAIIFAGIVMVSYPSSEDIPQPIPIVQADAGPLKSTPEEAGGMEIANRDTTVFDAVDAGFEGGKPVENLLEAAPPEEVPMSKEEVLAKLEVQEDAAADEVPAEISENLKAPTPPVLTGEKTAASTIDPVEASAKGIPLPRPQKMHEPGASPDTIAFVRSVLDKKDGKTTSAAPVAQVVPDLIPADPASAPVPVVEAAPQKQEIFPDNLAKIEPAVGTPAPVAVPGGTHYVQMVSVPSRSAAEAEWTKIQKSFTSILSSAPYRIQEANLGEKGTYYRVQVGPYDEAAAKSLCEQVKAQKPGGCLVVR